MGDRTDRTGDGTDGTLEAEKIVMGQIVEAARSSVYRRVMFLGPYARRVSFSSQQNRALNLLWALERRGELSAGRQIAVVGAGVSGVTLAAALQMRGHCVKVYESNSRVLERQIRARHRYIHPNVNRWPEDEIRESTIGPYFDWISDICVHVLKAMKSEWARVKNNIDLVSPVEVISFSEPASSKKVAIRTRQEIPENRDRYDFVFVTSGFSEEPAASQGLPTYWDNDDLDGKHEKTTDQFLVSGVGDGGLIDALRIAHRDFDDGRITVKLAVELQQRGWEYNERIADCEYEVSATQEALEKAITTGSDMLASLYQEAALNLPDDVSQWLSDSLRLQLIERIELIAVEKWPYSPMAAPVHKLLLAHAMNEGVITHTRARVVSFSEAKISYYPIDENGNEEKAEVEVSGVIVIRHGSAPNFARFFKNTKAENEAKLRLIDRQKKLSSDADRPLWREGLAPLMQWPPAPPYLEAIKARRPLADEIVHRVVGMAGKLEADEERGFILDSSDPSIFDRLPREIFGFPLTSPANSVARLAGAREPRPIRPRIGFGPGSPLIGMLNGRAGPIVGDETGSLFLLTAAHVVWSPNEDLVSKVIGADGVCIGQVVEDQVDAIMSSDIARVRLSFGLALHRSYGQHAAFNGVASPRDLFGASIFLMDGSGENREGYVSASLAAVRYRHAGGPEEICVPNAVRVRPMDLNLGFATGGDSGAPVTDVNGNLLGLVIAEDGTFTYLAPLEDYFARNKLHLATDEELGRYSSVSATAESANIGALATETMIQMARFRRLDLEETPVEIGAL